MFRPLRLFLTTLPPSAFALLLAAPSAHAATFSGQPIAKAEWTTGAPSWIDFYMATPAVMPAKPPILVNIHACGNSASSQWSYEGFNPLKTAMDSVGFIMILPQQTRNCFDSGSADALARGGNDDMAAIVEMVQYTIENFNADPDRVYVMGGSGGGMATQTLLAVYPDVFKAGHARAGAPAGCWGVNYDDGQQWSDPCAGGTVNKTAQEWGDLVRSYYPDFTGTYPRIQINQGETDTTISFNNYAEGREEWTNLLELSDTPTSTETGIQGKATYPMTYTYDRQTWDDACGFPVLDMWTAKGQGHSMGYEAQLILEYFGLDAVREKDPWDEMCGDLQGTGGASGTGGAGSGTGGADTGAGGIGAGVGGTGIGTGGVSTGVGGTGSGVGGSGVVPGSGGAPAGTGSAGVGTGGSGATGGTPPGASGGCALVTPSVTRSALPWALLALGYGLLRRRRSVS